ncbi:macro domain-containing protein [Streptomyces sp. SID3343]|uniref:macro domain-containing protein n=1 Tax=Streptomyces sp. SID3343 TaxID=2690260 RepID=UPI00136940A6|nr:macro domain-containing protein [Streptomyces sp. SID3343]MYW02099.1 Appr-1-p processing protein [Streptomyces sp. SID3343]
MTSITYVAGDATTPLGKGVKIVAHVCNDMGGWGKGFVLALSRRWPEPEADYRRWHRERAGNDFGLGAVRLVRVDTYLWVANMIGQHGTRTGSKGPPVRYGAIDDALTTLGERALELGASVHMPRIGCGLAGGRWGKVEPLVLERLSTRGVQVTVYDHD